MRRGGGGGGGGLGGDHSTNPVHATVGILTAALIFGMLWHLLRMPFVRPNMFMRLMVCSVVTLPLTVFAGGAPYVHIWWDILVVICAAWVSEAVDNPKPVPSSSDDTSF